MDVSSGTTGRARRWSSVRTSGGAGPSEPAHRARPRASAPTGSPPAPPWLDDAFIQGETGQHLDRADPVPGRQAGKVTWFGPIQRPRMGGELPAGSVPRHVYLTAPGWGDWGGHIGEASRTRHGTGCPSTRATRSSTGATPSTSRFPGCGAAPALPAGLGERPCRLGQPVLPAHPHRVGLPLLGHPRWDGCGRQ